MTLKDRRYHLAFAAFQAEPQRGVPGGKARVEIGRPLVIVAVMTAPPKKPKPEWSKWSLLKSSITIPYAPAPMNGLMYRCSKNTPTRGA